MGEVELIRHKRSRYKCVGTLGPLSTNRTFLQGIISAAAADSGTAIQKTLFDSTQMSFWVVDENGTWVECSGLFYSLVEIIEVLAWIGAALREATDPSQVMQCLPCLMPNEDYIVRDLPSVHLRLGFSVQPLLDYDSLHEHLGTCWLPLLRNPVITTGFPIPHRIQGPGLEISLKAMALQVNAPSLTFFNEKAVFKGFNAAIVATRYHDHVFQRHLILRESRLPYSDPWILGQRLSLGSIVSKSLSEFTTHPWLGTQGFVQHWLAPREL